MHGVLFVVSAPSGAGKTSLVKALLKSDPSIRLSVSYTTRAARPGEIDGKDYHFVSRQVFDEMKARGEFLESAEVYGNFYGTSKPWIDGEIKSGQDILLEIDWQGAKQVKMNFPEAVSIYILPPSRNALRNRLLNRAQDSQEVIERRLASACDDVSHASEFEYIIVNDDFDHAVQELKAVTVAARLMNVRQMTKLSPLLEQFRK